MDIVEKSNTTLCRIEDNDPKLTYLNVVGRDYTTEHNKRNEPKNLACFWLHDGADLSRLGSAIANNTRLDSIALNKSSEWTLDTTPLIKGLQRNTLIKKLSLHGSIGIGVLNESVANISNLTDISLYNGDLRGGVAGTLTSAMNICPNLNEITICVCKVDDASLNQFASGIIGISSLQRLRILHATAVVEGNDYSGNIDGTEGAKSIVTLFQDPSCNINNLDVASCGFNNESIQLIVNGLRGNAKLEHLRLFGSSVGRSGCESIVRLLQDPSCNLTSLTLGGSAINNESVKTIVRSLAGNTKLKHLGLSGSRIGSGCESIISLLQTPSCSITKLNLRDSGFKNESTTKLVTSLKGNTKIEHLDLSVNNIGRSGYESIANLLQEPNSSINNISLSCCNMGNNCATILAQALVGNSKLKRLDLTHNGITESGWNAFSPILSNSSNQTLLSLGDGAKNMPTTLPTLLKLNHVVDMEPLFKLDSEDDERNLKALPPVIDWFGRIGQTTKKEEVVNKIDARKLSSIFQFARTLPLEFVPPPSGITLLHREARDELEVKKNELESQIVTMIKAKKELEDKIKVKDKIIKDRLEVSDSSIDSLTKKRKHGL